MEMVELLIELYAKLLSIYNKRIKCMVEESSNELSYSHINYLEIIASKQNLKPSALAKHMGVSKPAVTSITDVLIKKGYIVKSRCPEDKRAYYLNVTDEYKKYRFPGSELTRTFLQKFSSSFEPDEIDYIKQILKRIIKIV